MAGTAVDSSQRRKPAALAGSQAWHCLSQRALLPEKNELPPRGLVPWGRGTLAHHKPLPVPSQPSCSLREAAP